MPPWLAAVVALLTGILGSSGIWAIVQDRQNKRNANNQLLIGLAHDRIIELCEKYISRGWITADEYENLHDYLFIPYAEAGGNGTAARLMDEVKRLPVKTISKEGAGVSYAQ